MKGGKRPGAGRKKGSKSKRTQETLAAIESSGLTPLQYLTQVYQALVPPELSEQLKNNQLSVELMQALSSWHARRLDAAKAAAQYVHPRLQALTVAGPNGGPIQFEKVERVIIDPCALK